MCFWTLSGIIWYGCKWHVGQRYSVSSLLRLLESQKKAISHLSKTWRDGKLGQQRISFHSKKFQSRIATSCSVRCPSIKVCFWTLSGIIWYGCKWHVGQRYSVSSLLRLLESQKKAISHLSKTWRDGKLGQQRISFHSKKFQSRIATSCSVRCPSIKVCFWTLSGIIWYGRKWHVGQRYSVSSLLRLLESQKKAISHLSKTWRDGKLGQQRISFHSKKFQSRIATSYSVRCPSIKVCFWTLSGIIWYGRKWHVGQR